MEDELRGVGIGHRRELAHEPAARREAIALAELWPVVPHGVKLSLGSAEGIDLGRARDFARLAREVRAPLVTRCALPRPRSTCLRSSVRRRVTGLSRALASKAGQVVRGRGPCLMWAALGAGHEQWVVKGFGPGAPVRVIERGARR